MNNRSAIYPILNTIPEERQKLARYYGVHPYFTRRSANVIQTYIKRFTQAGDTVCDPFGGTGVTAIEALLLGRKAIHNDLNPFANFMAEVVGDTSLESVSPLSEEFAKMETTCREKIREIEKATDGRISKMLKEVRLPENIHLPKNSDAKTYYELFTPKQLLGLATLKEYIDSIKNRTVRNVMLLAWCASMAKLNKTFISAKGRAESRGGSSIFSIYRYKVAKQNVELPIWETYKGRFDNLLVAKKEVIAEKEVFNSTKQNEFKIDSKQNMRIYSVDVCTLPEVIGEGSVDYIYTDPPYGGHIAYLDLSIMWNHWLGFTISEKRRSEEAIVGGELGLSESHYLSKLEKSVDACFKLLKKDRWISIVFQHWNSAYFKAIIQTASNLGGDLRAAITQERDVVWSMHKKKNAESVLAAEMVLTFYNPKKRAKYIQPITNETQLEIEELLEMVLLESHANKKEDVLSSDYLFNQVILMALHTNSLSTLEVPRDRFVEYMKKKGWTYNIDYHGWNKCEPNVYYAQVNKHKQGRINF
ncbi:MAG: DNA adenine methylase [Nitrospinae bacterium]|nr:DNA adenine methylase [Nitrospinota bacterium]